MEVEHHMKPLRCSKADQTLHAAADGPGEQARDV